MLCCLVLAAMAGLGQTTPAAKPGAPSTKKNTAVSKGSAGHSAASDVQLERKISARFAASKISVNHFQVSVQGGVATITGRTDVIQHKGTATRLAKTSGAVQVINLVEVSEAAKQRASKNLASGGQRAQVKRSDVPSRK